MPEQEKRQFKRVDFLDAVEVTSESVEGAEAQTWHVQCIDISMQGMLLQVDGQFPEDIGTLLEVQLMLSEDVVIDMPCTLVHREEGRAGIRADIMSLDSMSNLRRLLELNLADMDEVERELGALIRQTH